jgi:hypothetical protein
MDPKSKKSGSESGEKEYEVEPEAPERDGDDDSEEEQPGEPGDDADSADGVEVAAPAERSPRRDRRAARKGSLMTALKERETEARELRERIARMEGALSAQEQRRAAPESPKQRDPLEEQLEDLETASDGLVALYNAEVAGAKSPERLDSYRERARALEKRRRALENALERKRTDPPQRQNEDPQAAAARVILMREHADVMAHPSGEILARAMYQAKVQQGADAGWATLADTMEAVRSHLNMTRKAPTQAARDRLAAPGRGASSGDDHAPTIQKKYKMSETDMAAADLLYKAIRNPEARYAKFVQVNIKRRLEKKLARAKAG